MEATYSSEMLVEFQQTTRRDIPKDRTLRRHVDCGTLVQTFWFVRKTLIPTRCIQSFRSFSVGIPLVIGVLLMIISKLGSGLSVL
jgi:hypothetical protein